MKNTMLKISMFCLFVIGMMPSSFAQSTPAPQEKARKEKPQKDHFAALNLTEAQKPKFNAIKEEYRKQAKRARERASSRGGLQSMMDSIRERERKEVKALLTKKQFKQYVEIMKEMKPRQGRPGGGQGRRGQGNK